MKVIVFSDSHGNMDWMIAAMEEERPDYIFFLGDHERDGHALSRLYPHIPADIVRGNCDWGQGRDTLLTEVGGLRFFLTHGHLHGAKTGLLRLRQAGRQAGADMVCFGHTHVAASIREEGEPWLFNPGTIGGPYGQRVTYGLLQISNGELHAQWKDAGTT